MKPKNTDRPDHYSRADLVEGLKYIANEVGSLMSADELDAEIEKARLAASRMPVPDVAAFKAQVLERMKRGRETSGEKIIEFRPTQPSNIVSEEDQGIALAARKRKHPLRKSPQEKRKKGSNDGPTGSQ